MIEKIQEEKAVLCNLISAYVMRIPHSVANGSIQKVREWKHDRAKAESILRNKRSSVHELTELLKKVEEKYK